MKRRDRNHQSNRWQLGLGVTAIGTTLASGALAYATLVEPRSLLVRRLTLALPNLPEEMSGIRAGFLTDFHLGGPGDPLGTFNRALVELRNLAPDLILLGGDYYDRGIRVPSEPDWDLLPAIAPTFAVPGNHDYNCRPEASEEIFEMLAGSGINLLRNQNTTIPVRGCELTIIGLDDPYTGRADYDRATRDIECPSAPRIMLAHAGLVADDLPIASADLILSGHTHGAQIRFSPFRRTGPLDIFWWLDHIHGNRISPYRHGLFRVRGSLIYTANGLGATSLGARFLAPPEVTLVTFVRDDGDPELDCDDPERFLVESESHRIWPGLRS